MTDKKLQTKLDDKECDIVTGFATYLMQKQQDEIDELKAEIKRLEKENERLSKALVDNLEAYKDGFSEGAEIKNLK